MLVRGLRRFSRAAQYRHKGLWKITKKNYGPVPKKQKTEGETSAAAPAAKKSPKDFADVTKFLPTEKKHIVRHGKAHLEKLRKSLVPGTILILIAGRFKGKRVVFLKQLEKSGLLLVTGPFGINGVPLRRVAASYVIATSTKLDISKVDVSAAVDKLFVKPKAAHCYKSEAEFFDDLRARHQAKRDAKKKAHKEKSKVEIPKTKTSEERLQLQKKIDEPIIAEIKRS